MTEQNIDDADWRDEISYMLEVLVDQKLKTVALLKQSSDKLAASLEPLEQREFLALLEEDLDQEELFGRQITPSPLSANGGL